MLMNPSFVDPSLIFVKALYVCVCVCMYVYILSKYIYACVHRIACTYT